MSEECAEYYGITDPPGWTVPDELKPSILELLRLQRKEQKYQWISTKRKDPEYEGNYLTACKHKINSNRFVCISYYDCTYGWEPGGIGWSEIEITHWMPLPEPPESEGQK